VIAVKFGKRSVKPVGTALCIYLNERAAVAAFLSGERVCGDPDLADGVRLRSNVDDAIARVAVRACAIDLVLVCLLALPSGVDLEAWLGLEAVLVQRSRSTRAAEQHARPCDARRESRNTAVDVASHH